MSVTIDERVVEMRFDNKQFERETKTTMSTLSKLKEALKFPGAEKSLQNIDKAAKNINLEGIAAGVEMLTKRFSAFGIASMQIIQNVTNALTNKLAAAVNFVSDSIVSGGIKRAMNIENAHFQLQALLKDELKVQAVMDNAMESVDGTAFAYDEAAKAASMFAASGLQAGEEMLQALKGITGVAAMTNSDFESISRIFTTVAGNGRLMGDQLLQLSSRGMNAAATIADWFKEVQGQADMTESSIREMVTGGEISFKIFSDAMTWAFGDSAKRANETFTGALSNMKSALARIGAGFVSPFVEQNGEMVNLFNALRIKINEVKSALVFDEQTSAISGMAEQANVMVQTVATLTKEGKINFDMFTSAILGAGKSEEELAEINQKLAVTFGDINASGYASNEALMSIKNTGIDVYDALVNYLNGVADGTIKATGQLKASVRELTDGSEVSKASVIRFANEGKISFDMFNNAIVNYSGLVQKEGSATSAALKAMLTSVKDSGGVTNEILKDFRDNGLNATSALLKYINGVTDGTIRASYATKKEIEDLTGGLEVSISDIHRFADEGSISFNTFQSAMETAFGNSEVASKRFTDFALDRLKELTNFISTLDLTKPLDLFYVGIDTTINSLKALGTVLSPISSAFKETFNDFSIDTLLEMGNSLKHFTSNLKLSEENSNNLKDAFKGVFDVGKLFVDILGELLKSILPISTPVSQLGTNILSLAGSFGRTLSKMTEWIRSSKGFEKTFDTLKNVIIAISNSLSNFQNKIKELINSFKEVPIITRITNSFKDALGALSEKFDDSGNRAKIFSGIMDLLFTTVSTAGSVALKVFEGIGKAISVVFDTIRKVMSANGINSIVDLLNISVLIGLGKQLSTFMDNLNRTVSSGRGIFGSIKAIGRSLTHTLEGMQSKLNADALKSIAVAIGIIAASMLVLAGIDSDKLAATLGVVSVLLFEMLAVYEKISGMMPKFKGRLSGMSSLVGIAGSVLILAVAVKKISEIDSDSFGRAIAGVSILLGEMTGVAVALSKWGGKIETGILSMIGFAEAISILSDSVAKLAQLNWGELEKGLVSVGVLLGELAGFMIAAKFGKLNPKDAASIFILAEALKVLQDSIGFFGTMDTGNLIQGIVSLGALLAELAAFSLAAGEANHVLSTATSMVILSKAIEMMTGPMQIFGQMSLAEIGHSLLLLGGALGEIAIAMNLMPKNTIGISTGLLIASEAITILSSSLLSLGGMSWGDMAVGLVALGGALAELAIALNFMKGTAGAAMSLMIISGALAILTPTIISLSQLSIGEVVTALITLAGSFAVFGGAAFLLAPVIPVLYGLAGAIAIIAGSISVLLLAITVSDAIARVTGFFGAFSDFFSVASWTAGAVLITEVIKTLILGLINGIVESSAAIIEGAITLIHILCEAVKTAAPELIETFLVLIEEVLTSLATHLPEITHQLLQLFITMIDTLAEDIPTLVHSAMNFFKKFYLALKEELEGIDAGAFVQGLIIIGVLSALMVAMAGLSTLAIPAMKGVLAMGAVVVELTALIAALGAIAQIPGLKWLLDEGGEALQLIGEAIGQFVGGIVGGLIEGVTSALPKIAEDLSQFMENLQPFLDGASGIEKSTMDAVGSLAGALLVLTAAELVQGIASWLTGGFSLAQFGAELALFGPSLKTFANSVSGLDNEAVTGAANAVTILADAAENLPNSGGLAAKILGDNTLSDFGEELKSFAPNIVEFAEKVKDVKAEAVTGAANAVTILADAAEKLPNSGGFAEKIFGDNTLSDFGKELKSFGPNIVEFAEKVKDVKAEAVTGAANAVTILAEMAENMPNTNTLWEKIFGGGTISLSTFSEDLISFGTNMTEFTKSLKDFDGSKIIEVVDSFKALVDLSNYIGDSDSWTIVEFSGSLSMIATDAVDAFVATFEGSDEKVKNAITTMIGYTVTAVENSGPAIKLASGILGSLLVTALSESILEKKSIATSRVVELSNALIDTLKTNLKPQSFYTISQSAFDGITSALTSKKGGIISNVKNLGSSIIQAFRSSLPSSSFNTITQNGLQGIISGINYKKTFIITALRRLSSDVISNLRNTLTVNAFSTIGSNVGSGLETGIKRTSYKAQNAASGVGSSIINAMTAKLQGTTFQKLGVSIVSNLISGINSQAGEVQKAAQNLVDIANQTMSGVAQTINEQMDAVTKSTQETMNEVTNTLKNTKPNQAAQNVGKNTSKGVSVGIRNEKQTVVKAARDVALAVPKEMQKVLQIQSPSRVAAELGEYISIGLAEGIADKEPEVTEAVDNIVKAILMSLTQLMTMEYGEQISICLADGISNQQSAVEDAIDRIIRSVEQKIEDLKEYINNTMEAIDDKYFTVTPEIDSSWDMDDVDGIIGDAAVEGLPGGIIGDDFKNDVILDGDYDVIIGEGVVEPIIGDAAKEFEGVLGDAIQEGFNEAIGSAASNAQQIQSSIKEYNGGVMSTEPAREYEKVIGDSMQELAQAITGSQRVPAHNTFYISGNDPQEIAVEVSRILQHQVERTEKTWA